MRGRRAANISHSKPLGVVEPWTGVRVALTRVGDRILPAYDVAFRAGGHAYPPPTPQGLTRSRLTIAIAILTGVAASSGAVESDLSEQRLACQQESRRSVNGPRHVDVGLYTLVMERRKLYILSCMENGSRDVDQTGSISIPRAPPRPSAR
jgi:hypothetical protein